MAVVRGRISGFTRWRVLAVFWGSLTAGALHCPLKLALETQNQTSLLTFDGRSVILHAEATDISIFSSRCLLHHGILYKFTSIELMLHQVAFRIPQCQLPSMLDLRTSRPGLPSKPKECIKADRGLITNRLFHHPWTWVKQSQTARYPCLSRGRAQILIMLGAATQMIGMGMAPRLLTSDSSIHHLKSKSRCRWMERTSPDSRWMISLLKRLNPFQNFQHHHLAQWPSTSWSVR